MHSKFTADNKQYSMSFSTFSKDIIGIFENIRIDESNNYLR